MGSPILACVVLLAVSSAASAQLASGGAGSLFTGFNNETFEFAGQAGHSYTVISDGWMHVNMELDSAGVNHVGPNGQEGTVVAGMSVLWSSIDLYAHVDMGGNMTIYVNGLKPDIELPARFNQERITYEPYMPGFGQVLTIQGEHFKLAIVSVKSYTDEAVGFTRGHFDLHARVTSQPRSALQGLLGATLGLKEGEKAPHDPALFEVPNLSHKAVAVEGASDVETVTAEVEAVTTASNEPDMSAARRLLSA